MLKIPWVIPGCLVFAMCASASTCTIGTASSPTDCQISGQSGLFTWTISDIQVVAANVNVTPGLVTMSAAATGITGADQLAIVEQVTPPTGGNFLTSHLPVILDLTFDLSVTSTLTPSGPTPPQNSEAQTYLNGLLLATVASSGIVPGLPGVDGTSLNQETTVAVDDIFIVSRGPDPYTFTDTFDIANPQNSGGNVVIPTAAPEPASLALLALAAVLVCLRCISPRRKRLFRSKLMFVTHHDLFEDRRKIVR